MKFWCSTKVDINGSHIPNQNEYGYCSDDCPVSKGVDVNVDDDKSTEVDYNDGTKHIHYHFHNHNGKPCSENHYEDIEVNMIYAQCTWGIYSKFLASSNL